MGKGDKKTKRGKIIKGTYGKKRPRKKDRKFNITAKVTEKKVEKEEVKEKKTPVKKKAVKVEEPKVEEVICYFIFDNASSFF